MSAGCRDDLVQEFESPSAHRDQGVTALEYAIIAGLIAVVIVASVQQLGTGVTGLFQQVEQFFAAL